MAKAKTKEKTETKTNVNIEKKLTFAVKNMVDFVKDEVDRAVAHLSTIEKIDKSNAESVSNVLKATIDSSFQKTIETTDFERMKRLEQKEGFFLAKTHKKTGKKVTFFNLGPKNDWKKMLDEKIRKKIEEAFKKEMVELGYL